MPSASAAWASKLEDVALRQVPYATARALNQAADLAQLAQRNADRSHFQIRQGTFFDRLIKIAGADRAKKDSLNVTIRVIGPNARPDRGNLLAKFEAGGQQSSIAGRQYVAYPSKDILAKGAKLPKALRLARFKPFGEATQFESRVLGARHYQATAHAERTVGQQGSFILTLKRGASAGRPALAQRTKSGLRLLYLFVPSVRVDTRLSFGPTVRTAATKALPITFKGELAAALATARWGGGRQATVGRT